MCARFKSILLHSVSAIKPVGKIEKKKKVDKGNHPNKAKNKQMNRNGDAKPEQKQHARQPKRETLDRKLVVKRSQAYKPCSYPSLNKPGMFASAKQL